MVNSLGKVIFNLINNLEGKRMKESSKLANNTICFLAVFRCDKMSLHIIVKLFKGMFVNSGGAAFK